MQTNTQNNYAEVRNYLIDSLQEVADVVELEAMSDFELLDYWMIYHGILAPNSEPLIDRIKLLKQEKEFKVTNDIGLLFEQMEIEIYNLINEKLIKYGFHKDAAQNIGDDGYYFMSKAIRDMEDRAIQYIEDYKNK